MRFVACPHQDDKDIVAKGKKAFDDYRCFECHGRNGEGTDDAPDLIHSHLTAEEIEKTLEKPSADADAKGMPAIPPDSPDLKPLVAFVLSLRRPAAHQGRHCMNPANNALYAKTN